MTVLRRGDDEGSKRFTQSLGRVQVTIDDLRALRDLLADVDGEPDHEARVEMGFRGGTFTEPEELVKLTDSELEGIWVRSPNVEVELSWHVAEAAGRREIVEAVVNRWARMRPAEEKPALLRARGREAILQNAFAGVVFAAIVGVGAYFYGLATSPLATVLRCLAVGLGAFIIGFPAQWLVSRMSGEPVISSHATILPLMLAEVREGRKESRKHWRIVALMAIAACIALSGVLISGLVKR
jgi:hypothetical protein